MVSLPSFAQQCTTNDQTCIEILPPNQALQPSSSGNVWVGGIANTPHPFVYSCQQIGCESIDPDDEDYDKPIVADIQCFGSTISTSPLTTSQVSFQQNQLDAFESAINATAGLIAGGVAAYFGAGAQVGSIAGVVVTYLTDAVLDLSSTVWCGKQTSVTSRMCVGTDIDLLGLEIDLSDTWGDHVTVIETSVTTGVCVDDMGIDNNNL